MTEPPGISIARGRSEGPPADELPAVIPDIIVLAYSSDTVLTIENLQVFSRGLFLTLGMRFSADYIERTSSVSSVREKSVGREIELSARLDRSDSLVHVADLGGMGSARLWHRSYWMTPLPGDNTDNITFRVVSSAHGLVGESRMPVERILGAAQHVTSLFKENSGDTQS
ncbi:hypothetical protein [Phytoactinopolyspora halophila]|uniref:hypothetical protein n=1 Tax=Phytoactinopolyspora halophila TaxID=1981511 RepID=UPI000F4FF2AB|nr:hypothetical protein [Phytoactinopolyspora halophila]